MKFNVVKNRIARLDSEMLTTKNVNSIECSFTFSDDYSGLDLYAVFYRDENTNCFVELSDGQCILPHEMLEDGGTLCVGAYGVKNTSDTVEKRITTNCVKIQIYPSLSSSASPSAAPTPDMWEQYKQEILAYKAETETARAGAQEAKKEAETAKDTAISNADIASEKAAVATQMAENAYSSAREASESAQLVAPVVEDVNQLKSDLSLISGKMVQSVNNQKPDENGNVTVEAGSGGGDIALGITGATVGQIAKITAVDDTGKPTAWEPMDMASAVYSQITLAEAVSSVEFSLDGATEFSVAFRVPVVEAAMTYCIALINGKQSNFMTINIGSTSVETFTLFTLKRVGEGIWFIRNKSGNNSTYVNNTFGGSNDITIFGGAILTDIETFGIKCFGTQQFPVGTTVYTIKGGAAL